MNVVHLRPAQHSKIAGTTKSFDNPAKTELLTPREVERRHPELSRDVLAKRRMLDLPPSPTFVAGCIFYADDEIKRFVTARAEDTRPGAPPRCAIYARAAALIGSVDTITDEFGACEAHLWGSGWSFAGSTVDFGPPNTVDDLRGGFRDMLKQAALGEFDVLLVPDLSHISTKASDLRTFIRQFKKANVCIHEAPEGEIPTV